LTANVLPEKLGGATSEVAEAAEVDCGTTGGQATEAGHGRQI